MADELLDEPALARWLRDHTQGGREWRFTRISTGASNELFDLEDGDVRWVLRRPPARHPDPARADEIIARECRVLRALDATSVPHPRLIACCDDPAVVGAAFLVMEHVDGVTIRDPMPAPFATDHAARHALGLALVDTLVELGKVDWRAVGLDGFGRPDGFLDRQVGRWSGQLERTATRELAGLGEIARWLEEHQPTEGLIGLMHGDYQFVNVMFRSSKPAEVLAVVDWEQATIGDPLLDLGWLLAGWADPGEPVGFTTYLMDREGQATRAEIVNRYAERSGHSVESLDYYVVLALFKLACVLEGGYTRFVAGTSPDPQHEEFGRLVVEILGRACAITRGAPAF